MTAGRPTKYSEEILKKTQKYLDLCIDGYARVASKQKRRVIYTNKVVIKIPTMGGLARYLRVHRDTLYEWAKHEDNKEFSDIIGDLMGEQEDRLINNGLSGDYNPTIAKVLLAKHGYREGHEFANPDGSNVFRPSGKDDTDAKKALSDL